jgi:hypothetical protein
MSKKKYKIAVLAKQHLRRIYQLQEEGLGPNEIFAKIKENIPHTSKNQSGAYVIATLLLNPVMKIAQRKNSELSRDELSAKIDSSVSLLADGWERKDSMWEKKFSSLEEIMDFRQLVEGLGLCTQLGGINDQSQTARMSSESHQTLLMVLEGRIMEIEPRSIP